MSPSEHRSARVSRCRFRPSRGAALAPPRGIRGLGRLDHSHEHDVDVGEHLLRSGTHVLQPWMLPCGVRRRAGFIPWGSMSARFSDRPVARACSPTVLGPADRRGGRVAPFARRASASGTRASQERTTSAEFALAGGRLRPQAPVVAWDPSAPSSLASRLLRHWRGRTHGLETRLWRTHQVKRRETSNGTTNRGEDPVS